MAGNKPGRKPKSMSSVKTVAAPMSMPTMSAPMSRGNNPYSFSALVGFFNNNASLVFIGAALFLGGIAAGSLWTENKILKQGGTGAVLGQVQVSPAPQGQLPEPTPAPLSDEDWKAIQENPVGIIGDPNAKVTMVEFTDYQCPFCGRYFTDSYGAIKKDYVDTGKVRILLRDQPLSFHPNAKIGALAVRCAADQGFLPNSKNNNLIAMHDALFSKQAEWSDLAKDAAIEKYKGYASSAGMNGDQLADCIKTEKFGKEVDADIALGTKVGANGTPTFFIEKEMIVGALPTATFTAAFDKNLN